MTTEKQKEKWISGIVGVFTDPIIVYPGGWGEDLPKWLKDQITIERLFMNMEASRTGKMTGTDAEASAYLMSASLEQPISHDWAEIYLYVAGKVIKSNPNKEPGFTMPKDIRVDQLNNSQMQNLNQLKDWIYDRRIKAREDRDRAGRREQKEVAAAEREALQPAMFDLLETP